MLAWIVEHNKPLVIVLWIVSSAIAVIYAWAFISDWRYNKRLRRHLRVGAVQQARYAVFDSWVRSGGETNRLAENVRSAILGDYRAEASRHGDEYYAVYEASAEEAERDLQAVLKIVKGAEANDQKD